MVVYTIKSPPTMDGKPSVDVGADVDQQQRSSHGRDTHATPPQGICDVYKRYQRMSDADVNSDLDVIDFSRGLSPEQRSKVQIVESVATHIMEAASREFLQSEYDDEEEHEESLDSESSVCSVYSHADFPGKRRPLQSSCPRRG